MLATVRFSDFRRGKKETVLQEIEIDAIRPNPYQPRKYFNTTALEELASSIRQYGVMQPITVRFINKCSYELVAGERRLRAAKLAGLSKLPCIIVSISDNDSAMIALIENLQRQDLSFVEEAEGYQNLMNDYHLTQEELAAKLGKNQSTIANKLRLLKLTPEILKKILENGLSERHARALLKIPDPDAQELVLQKVILDGLTVKKTEDLVRETLDHLCDCLCDSDENHEKRGFGDIRLFTNTIRHSLEIIKRSGIKAEYIAQEKGDYYEINIRIPYN